MTHTHLNIGAQKKTVLGPEEGDIINNFIISVCYAMNSIFTAISLRPGGHGVGKSSLQTCQC